MLLCPLQVSTHRVGSLRVSDIILIILVFSYYSVAFAKSGGGLTILFLHMVLQAQQLGNTGLLFPAPPATSGERAEPSLGRHSKEDSCLTQEHNISHPHPTPGSNPLSPSPMGLRHRKPNSNIFMHILTQSTQQG